MRKKILAFTTAVIVLSGLLYANNDTACVYIAYCGIPVTTVCPGYFDNYVDLFTYQGDLDDIYCDNAN